MHGTWLFVAAISLTLLAISLETHSLRCGTEEVLSNEDVKKLLDTCRRRVGENETEGSFDDDDEDEEEDEDDGDGDQNGGSYGNGHGHDGRKDRGNNSQRPYNFNGFNYQGDFQNDPYNPNYGSDPRTGPNYRTQNGRSGDGNVSPMGGMGNMGNMGGNRNGMANTHYGNSNSNSNSNNNNNNNWDSANRFGSENSYLGGSRSGRNDSSSFNQTKQDRECFLHCVFHEMKITNNENLPDKRKMLQVLTKNIRNHELKEFYVDSIQECFYVIDNMDTYRRRKDKCEVSAIIVSCLAERARTNCEDIQNPDVNMLLL